MIENGICNSPALLSVTIECGNSRVCLNVKERKIAFAEKDCYTVVVQSNIKYRKVQEQKA